MLAQAERFIESQGFHLMTKEDIPLFARCEAESYGDIIYALDDYFDFIRYGGIRLTLKLGLPAMRRIMHYKNYSAQNGKQAFRVRSSEQQSHSRH